MNIQHTTISNKSKGKLHKSTQGITRFFALSLFLLVIQPWSPRVSIFPFHILLIWFLFAIFFLFRSSLLKKRLSLFSSLQWISISILIISIFLRSSLDGWEIERVGQFITGIMIAILGSQSFQNEQGRKTVITALALGVTISSAFAILQYFNFAPWLWQASKYTGKGITDSTGLENNPVAFAYSIVGFGTFLLGSWLLRRRPNKNIVSFPSGVVFIFSSIIIIGLILSNSRSGLFGLSLGIALVLYGRNFIKTQRQLIQTKSNISSVSVNYTNRVVFTGYIALLATIGLTIYAVTAKDTGVFRDIRIGATWQFYIPYIWHNPLGMPNGINMVQALRELSLADNLSLILTETGIIISPHNLLLTTGISYGPLAMLALAVLYITALYDSRRAFLALKHAKDSTAASWILLLIAVNVSIIAHSWFHNASIAIGEMRNWLWLGLLLTVARTPLTIEE